METTNFTEEYNALSETAYIASSLVMMERINNAEENIMNGKGIKINIDDNLKSLITNH